MAIFILSLFLAALLGFAAHRASVCTVKAVAEVFHTRRAYMLLSFVKTILWITAISLPLIWLLPATRASGQGWGMSMYAVTGGFVFGMGATVNRGCAFSTLSHLGDGQVGMLLTLAGFCLGISGYVFLATSLVLPAREAVLSAYDTPTPWALMLVAGLWVWIVWEVVRIWRTWPAELTWTERVISNVYRLSTAAAWLGLSNGILYAIHGSWAYTSTLQHGVARLMGAGPGTSALQWSLFAALLTGMVFSSWQRGSFHLDWRPSLSWAQNLVGGLLMGLGAAMVPGGNDVLVLHSIPGLSPHALPAYVAMIAGIAGVMGIMRVVQGEYMKVDCSGDICTIGGRT